MTESVGKITSVVVGGGGDNRIVGTYAINCFLVWNFYLLRSTDGTFFGVSNGERTKNNKY